MKLIRLLIFIFIGASGCGTDIETITIQREGVLTFRVDGYDEVWRSRDFVFYAGHSVVKEFPDEDKPFALFRRHYLVFEGVSPDDFDFELSVMLDMDDASDMRHRFTSEYHPRKGGLHNMSLLLIERSQPVQYYQAELCMDALEDAYFEIERQNYEEKLIAGRFQAKLCFAHAEDSVFVIYDADFKDIPYE